MTPGCLEAPWLDSEDLSHSVFSVPLHDWMLSTQRPWFFLQSMLFLTVNLSILASFIIWIRMRISETIKSCSFLLTAFPSIYLFLLAFSTLQYFAWKSPEFKCPVSSFISSAFYIPQDTNQLSFLSLCNTDSLSSSFQEHIPMFFWALTSTFYVFLTVRAR